MEVGAENVIVHVKDPTLLQEVWNGLALIETGLVQEVKSELFLLAEGHGPVHPVDHRKGVTVGDPGVARIPEARIIAPPLRDERWMIIKLIKPSKLTYYRLLWYSKNICVYIIYEASMYSLQYVISMISVCCVCIYVSVC